MGRGHRRGHGRVIMLVNCRHPIHRARLLHPDNKLTVPTEPLKPHFEIGSPAGRLLFNRYGQGKCECRSSSYGDDCRLFFAIVQFHYRAGPVWRTLLESKIASVAGNR
jgi:hypothetical protein